MKTKTTTLMVVAILGLSVMKAAALTAGSGQEETASSSSGLRTLELRQGKSLPASTLAWDSPSQRSSSPEDVCKAVTDRVKYARDMVKEDEWRDGRDTWNKKEGDCEDYAVVIKDRCEEEGFKTEIYVVKSGTAGASHAITIGEVNGALWISSNGSYKEVESLNDAKETIARDLGWWAPDVSVLKVEKSPANGDRRYVKIATDTWR